MLMKKPVEKFTRYQVFMIALLAVLQFTVVLDFMVLAPLSPIVMKEMGFTASQFASVVSVYAFSAFASGMLAAGFADKFDRKKLLLFFYGGFVLGTLFCALSTSFGQLLTARIVTGLFGGVIGSISYAIIGDLFKMEMRGRVMGVVQTAFAASQILGIPIGLYLANTFSWHIPFYAIVGFSIVVAIPVFIYMQPITAHIAANKGRNAFLHLWRTLTNGNYVRGFLATTLLATGGFMLMPFGSNFATHNLGISLENLPFLYAITGMFSIVFGPIVGRLSDQTGKFRMFVIGSCITIAIVGIYTSLGLSPFWLVVSLNVLLFAGISARMIPAQALLTAVPAPQDRGAFMSINSSIQQLSGGVAAMFAGMIVYQSKDGYMHNYPVLGLVVICSMVIAVFLMRMLDRMVKRNPAGQTATVASEPAGVPDEDLSGQDLI